MSVFIRDLSYKKNSEPSWNDMDELKYLICRMDCSKPPPCVSPPLSNSVILPPRIEEVSCEPPPRRPPCIPPPRCCPITPGPCCPNPLPLPILPAMCLPDPFCPPCISSPYYFYP
ncbi:hypothetical protein ACFW04_008026 [Cataglyphis niger]